MCLHWRELKVFSDLTSYLKSNWSNREKNTGKFLFKSEYHLIRYKTMFIPININHFSHVDIKPIKALIISWVLNWKKQNYDSYQIWHLHKAYMYLCELNWTELSKLRSLFSRRNNSCKDVVCLIAPLICFAGIIQNLLWIYMYFVTPHY